MLAWFVFLSPSTPTTPFPWWGSSSSSNPTHLLSTPSSPIQSVPWSPPSSTSITCPYLCPSTTSSHPTRKSGSPTSSTTYQSGRSPGSSSAPKHSTSSSTVVLTHLCGSPNNSTSGPAVPSRQWWQPCPCPPSASFVEWSQWRWRVPPLANP